MEGTEHLNKKLKKLLRDHINNHWLRVSKSKSPYNYADDSWLQVVTKRNDNQFVGVQTTASGNIFSNFLQRKQNR